MNGVDRCSTDYINRGHMTFSLMRSYQSNGQRRCSSFSSKRENNFRTMMMIRRTNRIDSVRNDPKAKSITIIIIVIITVEMVLITFIVGYRNVLFLLRRWPAKSSFCQSKWATPYKRKHFVNTSFVCRIIINWHEEKNYMRKKRAKNNKIQTKMKMAKRI